MRPALSNMMRYEKQPQDLTVGDLEGMTLEEMEKIIADIEVPDYDAIFRKAKEAADAILAIE